MSKVCWGKSFSHSVLTADLEQLLHLLSEGAGPSARCSKARAMFAMRACRKSVMIGKALNKPQMTQLLRNMGTIDQPWVSAFVALQGIKADPVELSTRPADDAPHGQGGAVKIEL